MKDLRFSIPFIALNTLLPLFLGAITYLLLGSKNLIFFKIADFDILIQIADRVNQIKIIDNKIVRLTLSYLPDALWAYSFTSSLIFAWSVEFLKKPFYLIIPIVTGIIIETFQFKNIIAGTFDYFDILIYILFTFLSYYYISKPCYEKI
jgi:hypothetical protein